MHGSVFASTSGKTNYYKGICKFYSEMLLSEFSSKLISLINDVASSINS